MITMIDMGIVYQEGLRMTGIEGIVQELKDKRAAQVTVYQEIGAYIEALDFMIAAGEQQLNGHTVPENHKEKISSDEAWIMRANPFKAATIKWHCFEAMRGVIKPMHYTDVHKMVWRSRHCPSSSVYNVLYENELYFKRGEPGFFMQAGA